MNSFDEENHDCSDESDEELPPKRIALHQTSVPRYHKVGFPRSIAISFFVVVFLFFCCRLYCCRGLKKFQCCYFLKEFHEICLLGKGEFGSVHKCLNRLDGCTYAVKKSLMPVAGSPNE